MNLNNIRSNPFSYLKSLYNSLIYVKINKTVIQDSIDTNYRFNEKLKYNSTLW